MPETISPSAVAVTTVFTESERLALAGFLAGYSGQTRDAYTLDLRQFATWCAGHGLRLFDARRADIEAFGRALEAAGRARATVSRRLCTVAGLYRYAVEEELLDHSPAAHVRRPRLDYDSHAIGLDRNEVGAFLVAAGLGHPVEHALVSLLALNGLRVSEACGANIEALALERGHRTLICGREARSSPSPSRRVPPGLSTWPSVSVAKGRSSSEATVSVSTATPPPASSGGWLAGPGSPRRSGPTRCDTPSSPPLWTPESRCEASRRPPATPTPAPPCATTGPESLSTVTPPTSSPRSSPEPRDSRPHQQGRSGRGADDRRTQPGDHPT